MANQEYGTNDQVPRLNIPDSEVIPESTRLYVSNLAYSVTEDQLVEFLGSFGFKVTDKHLVFDRNTGRSRGFGFVSVDTIETAKQMIKRVDGMTLDGRQVFIKFAKQREQRSGGSGGGYHRNNMDQSTYHSDSRGTNGNRPHSDGSGGNRNGNDRFSRPRKGGGGGKGSRRRGRDDY